jgi:hypothetical protein
MFFCSFHTHTNTTHTLATPANKQVYPSLSVSTQSVFFNTSYACRAHVCAVAVAPAA